MVARDCPRLSSLVSIRALALAVATAVLPAPAAADHGPLGPSATSAPLAAAAREWSDGLRGLARDYQQGDAATRAWLLPRLAEAAARRRDGLLALIERDPGAVRAAALPAALRAGLPAEVQPDVEEDLEVEGELRILHADGGPRGGHHWMLRTRLGALALHWAGREPAGRLTGDRVRVRGLRVGVAMALGAGDVVPLAAAPLPNTLGAQSTLVILVNFADRAVQPYTRAFANTVVFGTTSDYYRENSFGQTWLTGVVRGWYTISESYASCNPDSIAQKAEQAAVAAGVNVAAYPRRVYAFPENGCQWWGLGTVGGYPSQSWVRGSFELAVVGHEMGHNFGLYHSHALDCGAAVVGGTCASLEYGDTLDMMGTGAFHFNAPQKERLGWLGAGNSPPITPVTSTGTYALSPYETDAAGAKALRIPRTGGNGAFYVEVRRPVGFDADLAGNTNVETGVLVHFSTGSPDGIYLLDMTPAGSNWWDPALVVGQSFSDGEVTISPLWVDATGAGVSVTVGTAPCAPAAPSVTRAPAATAWASPGNSATLSVTVRNNDQGGCAPATFAVSLSAAVGITGMSQPASVTIAPGGTATVSLRVDVPGGTAEGLYPFAIAAGRPGGPSASASGSLMVASALRVTTTTDRAVYQRLEVVTVTAVVTVAGLPVSGATARFVVRKADGQRVIVRVPTNASGIATYQYLIDAADPPGAWAARVVARKAGIIGQGRKGFQVQ